MSELQSLQEEIIRCEKCPRLVQYRQDVARVRVRRFADWRYWGRPLPSLGDPGARLLIVGMAPAAHGGNRTGRMFTGDRSGEWLFEALHRFGFSNQPHCVDREDNLELRGCYVTAVIRCAPPGNRPETGEIENCRPYLVRELRQLDAVVVYVALGRIAHQGLLRAFEQLTGKGERMKATFAHNIVSRLDGGRLLISSYHPSQQNTQTGRLSRAMWHGVFEQARALLDEGRKFT